MGRLMESNGRHVLWTKNQRKVAIHAWSTVKKERSTDARSIRRASQYLAPSMHNSGRCTWSQKKGGNTCA